MARKTKKPQKSSRFPKTPLPSTSSSSPKLVRTFSYLAIQQGAVRPVLPIVIHTARSRRPLRALVDSGADHSVFPQSWASHFGINLDECEEITSGTAGGSGIVRVHPVPLEAEVQAMHARFAMTSAYSEKGSTILLGRADFFKEFRVTFDEPAETFTLEKL